MKQVSAKPGQPIVLGRQGENEVTQVIFDLDPFLKLFGPGTVLLLAQRKGDTNPYPVAVEVVGNEVIWTVTSTDVAYPTIAGKCELTYYVGEQIAKTETFRTIVLEALGKPSEMPPDPYLDWFNKVMQMAVPISDTLPEPREDLRGRFWIEAGEEADKLYICMLKNGEPYWQPLNGSGEAEPDTETTSVLGIAVLGNMILGS